MSGLPAEAGPILLLSSATVLLLATGIDARKDRHRPLWLRLCVRATAFGGLTWLMQRALGSPIQPHTDAGLPGERLWAQLLAMGWWMLGARLTVGVVRLLVILENRPRETQIVSDLLAGAIYVTTGLAIVNFVLNVPIGGLLATSGAVAIILGLALQSTLSDVFSGIAVGLGHAYKPGDLLWVEGGIEGHVLQISWRSTRIATLENSVAIVPNSVIAKSRLENRSEPTPTRSVTLTVHADATADARSCIAALEAAALACRLPLPDPAPTVNCVALQGDGSAYEIGFVVPTSHEIPSARTEMLVQVQRHLRHAGIALGIGGVAPQPSATKPSLTELIASSDLFGALSPEEQHLFIEHFVATSRTSGETLFQEGETIGALFLLAAGTVEVWRLRGAGRQVLFRASPGDSIGMIGLITGTASLATATALTPISAYRLDKNAFSVSIRTQPALEKSLEAQARRGLDWLRCEAQLHEHEQLPKPDMLVTRLHQFLRRLNG